jgi:hypothetical protein
MMSETAPPRISVMAASLLACPHRQSIHRKIYHPRDASGQDGTSHPPRAADYTPSPTDMHTTLISAPGSAARVGYAGPAGGKTKGMPAVRRIVYKSRGLSHHPGLLSRHPYHRRSIFLRRNYIQLLPTQYEGPQPRCRRGSPGQQGCRSLHLDGPRHWRDERLRRLGWHSPQHELQLSRHWYAAREHN